MPRSALTYDLWVMLQLFCVGLDFVDCVVFDRREVLDDEGQGGVDSFSDGVDAGSLGEQIEPWPFGAPVCRFDDAFGFEFPQDPHLVVNDVWCQCIWTNHRTFANHDHVFLSYQAWNLGSEIKAADRHAAHGDRRSSLLLDPVGRSAAATMSSAVTSPSFTAVGLLDSHYAYSVAYMVRDRQEISQTRRKMAMTDTAEQNKALVLEAFETLFNRRDYAAALRFWSPDYIQHSAHIEPGRDGLFNLVKAAPADMHYENALIIANGDYVMAHGRLSNTGLAASWIAVDIVRLQDGVFAEHWDVLQFEATVEESKSGLPMFGDAFPTRA